MCADPNDPQEPGLLSLVQFSSGGFGYNVQAALADLDGVVTDVAEVVVSPTTTTGVATTDFPQISIHDLVVEAATLPQNVTFLNLPQSDQISWTSNNPTFGRAPSVDMQELNNQAMYLAVTLWFKYLTDGNEWGAAIYKNPDGSLHQTVPTTSGHTDRIAKAKLKAPLNATIVMWMHTHPYDPGTDQRFPSTSGQYNDKRFLDATISASRMDANVIAYVVADRLISGTHTMKIHGYDMNTIAGSTLGPELTGTP